MKKVLSLFGFIIVVLAAHAQNGEISGKLVDENGEGVISGNVLIVDAKGVSTGRGVQTDFDGNYSIKPLTPGKYNIMFSYVGYSSRIEQGVVVYADKPTWLNITLKPSSTELQEVEVVSYKVPLIDPGKTSSSNTVTAEEISNMATKSVTDIAATTSGAFQEDQGGDINIKGGRDQGTQYYIDGVKVTGVPTLPANAIEQLQVITGGVPAKYGDLTGGIINITSKGPSGEFRGSAEYQTTQGLDAYGWNLANANLTGPIWKHKKTKKTMIGFYAGFEFLGQKDRDPSAIGVWQVRPEVLDDLRKNPLVKKESETGFNLRSDNITYKDMFKQKVKPNTREVNYRGNGRIDFRPVDNITLAFGGRATYRKYHDWVEQYTLFNAENNPMYTELNWGVFGRFTHSIQAKQSDDDDKKKKSSAFQNAFYSVQVDYEKYMVKYFDDTHGFNPFDYGYIGKFETKRAPTFVQDTLYIQGTTLNGWKQQGFTDTSVAFTPGDKNVYGTAYTEQFYQILGAQQDGNGTYSLSGPNNGILLDALSLQSGGNDQSGALINGQRGSFVNSTWYNTGRQYNGYGIGSANGNQLAGDNDQYRVRLEGAFDILKPGAPSRNKHSIELGIEFEQRIQRTYSVGGQGGGPQQLWQRMRGLLNRQLTTLDLSNPTLRIGGVDYSFNDPNRPAFFETDTMFFNRLYVDSSQTFFDKSLRKALGIPVNSTDYIDVDALDPSVLKLDMFSPDELLLDGANLVSYAGYDPYGKRLDKQPSFNDFFTKKRADGEYERAIRAFMPIYSAAYISDRFYFKDLTFNVGVRIDRYDANQKVLKDEYSLYPIRTKGEATQFTHPSNIGDDYKVYVDDVRQPTAVTGYRNGNTWYDRYGRELTSGNQVAAASASGQIQPYLVDANAQIKNAETFDPNGSFEDYKPKIIVMPRLQFSFNVTDRALFFAHYDILSQRPGAESRMDPTQYLFFQDNIGSALNNPNLKPERTIDFEFGFKQRVSQTAAITISAFYREFRDQVQLRKIANAYPKDYITYQNIDFGTTKGFSLDFDMRRTGNFTIKANYTMQFAEGTGSDSRTQANLVSSNQPNFRSINFLDYDSRHLINVNATYSYGEGRDYNGPVIKNSQFLSNSGISLQLSTRSGTPYTAQLASTPDGMLTGGGRPISVGQINGSRLPWYFRLNLRVWKEFTWTTNKKSENKDKQRDIGLQIYLQIQNLLNTKNVVRVYRYTGTPNDNGYLSDPANLPAINSYLNPQAFRDQYSAFVNRPDYYSLPRRIYLGAVFSF